ncbi:hypothetical protein AVEN_84010-1 [Araneus ventricosus]|uniref:Uncharacterized protein n=1 Tax=Araneus ventricosus TaxID=182803 RepID=A0A4Y2BTD2_ARAVE|nr:hypothetical protein AVEN_84010-1 [Araneus ventricosus]
MVLPRTETWAYPLSARQERKFKSLQRKFILNISGAYSIPTEGPSGNRRTTPLHLKAEQEAVYGRVTRFGKASHLKDQNFDPKDLEGKVSTFKFQPA